MYARVPQVMAQFVPKIEKLSHIMGPNPILEMARAYSLRPRLWLLISFKLNIKMFISSILITRSFKKKFEGTYLNGTLRS